MRDVKVLKTCRATGKRRHRSEESAIRDILHLSFRGRDGQNRLNPLHVYRCRGCRDFHVGHRPTDQRPRGGLADVERAHHEETGERCACAPCRKRAVEAVQTPNGSLMVCVNHARRLKETYAT